MVFASPIFLFFFLPLVLTCYFVAPRASRNAVLLLFSLFFYAWGEAPFVLLILGAIFFNWVIGLLITRAVPAGWRRVWLAIGVSGDLGVLGYMKYANFAVENSNLVLRWLGHPAFEAPGIVLPLGVSFFTFHAISYLIDIYRRSAEAEAEPTTYALYILLFPQLIAGPIIRWKQIRAQLHERRETISDFSVGVSRFVVGLAKKMLIANPLGQVADQIFALPPGQLSASTAWLGLVCYTLQIYFDFSGYSDMAIGLMRMFGFRILENFDYPYISRSIREFWRRWHISLSSWFRDYVYIPLGGSAGTTPRTCLNIMIVFLLSGLWHGANWTFILWGAWHGLCICAEVAGLAKVLDRLGPLSHVYGLAAIMFGWVLFRSPTIEHAISYYFALFRFGHSSTAPTAAFYLTNDVLLALVLGCVGSMPIARRLSSASINLPSFAYTMDIVRSAALICLFALSAAAAAAGSYNPFIYFRF